MERLRISDLSGGVVNVPDPQKIPDNAVVSANNYEYIDGVNPTRRKTAVSIATEYPFSTYSVFSDVWYPNNMPEGAVGGKVYIEAEYESGILSYKFAHMGSMGFWEVFTPFVATATATTPTVRMFISADKVIIADGINTCRYVSINKDGEWQYGELGIPAPTRKLDITRSGTENKKVESDTTDVGMGEEYGSALEVCYTVETDTGEESNPSPISVQTFMMYKYPDAEYDLGYKYLWQQSVYRGLRVPDVPESTKERFKYYNIYRRAIQFTESVIGSAFRLVERVAISSQDNQAYTDTSNQNFGSLAYDNNVSPSANDIIETNKTVFLGGIKDRIRIPFAFDKYTPIKITNNNSRDYVNAVVSMTLTAGQVGLDDWSILTNKEKVRIFDDDLITPINVVYRGRGLNIDIYMQIPNLSRGTKTIYFCVAPNSMGVTDAEWYQSANRYKYGQFCNVQTEWSSQQVFQTARPTNNDHLICSNFGEDEPTNRTSLRNRANADVFGVVQNSGTYTPSTANSNLLALFGDQNELYPLQRHVSGVEEIKYTGFADAHDITDTNLLTFTYIGRVDPLSGSTFSRLIRFGSDDYIAMYQNFLLLFVNSQSRILMNFSPTVKYIKLLVSINVSEKRIYTRMRGYNTTNNEGFIPEPTTINNIPQITIDGYDIQINETSSGTLVGYMTQHFSLYRDTYIDDADVADNMLNYMPNYPEAWIGGKPTEAVFTNRNIVIEDTEDFANDSYENELRWSKLNGSAFPKLFSKKFKEPILRIKSVPSFLKQQYENTVGIWTRNTVSRMVMKEDNGLWYASANNVIEEYKSFGLYAPDSLVQCGNELLWFSELGVIRWNDNGLQKISKGKIDIPINNNYLGVYVPMRDQYILHNRATDESYVYHLDNGKWTTFTGLDIECDFVLDGGTDEGASNIFIGTSGSATKYPSETDETVDTYIITKQYPINNSRIIRARADAETVGSALVTSRNLYNVSQTSVIGDMTRGEWMGIANGVWGEYCQLRLDNFDDIRNIDIDIQKMGV
jgi:hypothetical protein